MMAEANRFILYHLLFLVKIKLLMKFLFSSIFFYYTYVGGRLFFNVWIFCPFSLNLLKEAIIIFILTSKNK